MLVLKEGKRRIHQTYRKRKNAEIEIWKIKNTCIKDE